MLSDITVGQYFPGSSPIHRLDPRLKICLETLYIAAVFMAGNAFSLILTAVFLFIAVILSGVPVRMYLKSFKAILPVILLTSVLNALYVTGGTLWWNWWIINIYSDGVFRAIYMTARILLLIISSGLLTFTTSPTELTDGIERLLSPLKLIGLGNTVHTLAMMMTIALRFIPTLIEETDKIMSAQKARGADMETGGLIKRLKSLMPVIIPLLLSSFRRAAELADAMECRCYTGGKGRTRMKQNRFAPRDLAAFFVTAAVAAGVVLLNVFI
jgi:energy-coupling factor transport system permease protein